MKEQEIDELVKRLKETLAHSRWDFDKPAPRIMLDRATGRELLNPDGPAAAAAIQALREQVKDAQKRIKQAEKHLGPDRIWDEETKTYEYTITDNSDIE